MGGTHTNLALAWAWEGSTWQVESWRRTSPISTRRPFAHFEEDDRHPEILRTIPIRVISNTDVSLLGAAFAATLPE